MSEQARIAKQYNHIVDVLDTKLRNLGMSTTKSRKTRISEMLFASPDKSELDPNLPLNFLPKRYKWITVRSPTIMCID